MKLLNSFIIGVAYSSFLISCGGGNQPSSNKGALSNSGAAEAVYVAPGEYDEFYEFFSGGFSGQVSVVGLPSGRMFRRIPVFSLDA